MLIYALLLFIVKFTRVPGLGNGPPMPVFREYMVQQPLSGSAGAGWKKQEVNQVFAAASTQASHYNMVGYMHISQKRLSYI